LNKIIILFQYLSITIPADITWLTGFESRATSFIPDDGSFMTIVRDFQSEKDMIT
jgi:hypothetical protein